MVNLELALTETISPLLNFLWLVHKRCSQKFSTKTGAVKLLLQIMQLHLQFWQSGKEISMIFQFGSFRHLFSAPKVRQKLAIVFFVLTASSAMSDDKKFDEDPTVIQNCDQLTFEMSIPVFSRAEGAEICQQAKRVLEGVRIKDLRSIEKGVYLLSSSGYKKGQYNQIAGELVEIIRLRGLYNKPDKWHQTIDLVWRVWSGWNGIIGPDKIIAFLKSSGKAAKTLSDDGLVAMLSYLKQQYQQGN